MGQITKNLFYAFLIIAALTAIIFGSYLPFSRGQSFIKAVQLSRSVKSLEDFKKTFNVPLEHPAPVGDEEVVKFLSNEILGILGQSNQGEPVSRALVTYIEPYLFQDNVRHMLTGAYMYQNLWTKFGQDSDYLKTEEYFKKAREIGPKLPPVLYGMLSLYGTRGDLIKAKEVALTINKYWPEDKRLESILQLP